MEKSWVIEFFVAGEKRQKLYMSSFFMGTYEDACLYAKKTAMSTPADNQFLTWKVVDQLTIKGKR